MQQEEAAQPRPRSVLIVDDHDIVRFGLEVLIVGCSELRLGGSAGSLAAALKLVEATHPDLVITDMNTGDSSGLDTVRAMVAAQAPRPVLVVSVHDEMLYGEQVIALGAKGYLMKENAHANVIPAALAILEGSTWLSQRLSAKLVNRALRSAHGASGATGPLPSLSVREFQILELLKRGKTTKEIATAMNLSVRTVDIYRARLKQKLGLRTGAELIAFASSHL